LKAFPSTFSWTNEPKDSFYNLTQSKKFETVLPWFKLALIFLLIYFDITYWGFSAEEGSILEFKLLYLKNVSDLTENGWFIEITVVDL